MRWLKYRPPRAWPKDWTKLVRVICPGAYAQCSHRITTIVRLCPALSSAQFLPDKAATPHVMGWLSGCWLAGWLFRQGIAA